MKTHTRMHTHRHTKKHNSWEMTQREIRALIDMPTNQLKLLHHCVCMCVHRCASTYESVCRHQEGKITEKGKEIKEKVLNIRIHGLARRDSDCLLVKWENRVYYYFCSFLFLFLPQDRGRHNNESVARYPKRDSNSSFSSISYALAETE